MGVFQNYTLVISHNVKKQEVYDMNSHWTDNYIEQSEFGWAAYDEEGLLHGYYDTHAAAAEALIKYSESLNESR